MMKSQEALADAATLVSAAVKPVSNSMSTEKKTSLTKRTYNLPSILTEQFEEIASRTGANSDTEVVKSAIKLYLYLNKVLDDDDKLIIQKKDGAQRELALFL